MWRDATGLRWLLGAASLLWCGCAEPGGVPVDDTAGLYARTGPTDQEQPVITPLSVVGGLAIGGNSDQVLAQVVTAGVRGDLVEVRLPVSCDSGDLVVQIQGVAGGLPDGCVRSTTIVPGAALPSFPGGAGFRSIELAQEVPLEVGTPFAITLLSTGECAIAQGPVGDSYLGGDGFFDARPNPVGTWEPLGPRADLPFQAAIAPDPEAVATSCSTCPDLDAWLVAHPDVAASIRWQFATGPVVAVVRPQDERAWPAWPASEKQELRDAFCESWAWWHTAGDPLADLQEDLVDPPPNVGAPMTRISAANARALYLSTAAHSLMVEIAGLVPWTVTDLDPADRDVLFASSSIVRRASDGTFHLGFTPGEFDPGVSWTWHHGRVVPAPPRYTFRFLASEGMLGPTRLDTIVELLDWSRHNLSHYWGTDLQTFQYEGAAPVSRTIEGTFHTGTTPPQFAHWTAGCSGTSGFLRAVLRTVNIPVRVAVACHHAPYFPSEGLYMAHGDDPYGLANSGGPRNGGNPSIPTSALLFDEATFDDWFGPSRVHGSAAPEACDNTSRRTQELVCPFPQVYCDEAPPDCGPGMVPEADPCPDGFCPGRCWTGECLPCAEECEYDGGCGLYGRHACSSQLYGDCSRDCEWALPVPNTDVCHVDIHHLVSIPPQCPATCDADPECPERCPECRAENARCETGECIEEWTSCEPYCTCGAFDAPCLSGEAPVITGLACGEADAIALCTAEVFDGCEVDCTSITARTFGPTGAPGPVFASSTCLPASTGLSLVPTTNGILAEIWGFVPTVPGLWRIEWSAADLEGNQVVATHRFYATGSGYVDVVVDETAGPVTGLDRIVMTDIRGPAAIRLVGPVVLAGPLILDDVDMNAPLVFDNVTLTGRVEIRSSNLGAPITYRNKSVGSINLYDNVFVHEPINSDDGDVNIPIVMHDVEVNGPMRFTALTGGGAIVMSHVRTGTDPLVIEYSTIDALLVFLGHLRAPIELSESDVDAAIVFLATDDPVHIVNANVRKARLYHGW